MKLNEIDFDLLSDRELNLLCLKYKLISKDKSVKLILNDLPINEAFEIYQQNKL